MRAMVLAAGIGSRLKPLTDKIPKALIEINGVPMLEIVLRRLIKAGVDAVVINVFHLPDPIEKFLESKKNFGIRIEISREEKLLDTGGGLKKAAPFFNDGKPFFLHNVDIVCGVDLNRLYQSHLETGALGTLSVRERNTNRYFLFDLQNRLCGWESVAQKKKQWVGFPLENVRRLAFDGISVLSPNIFPQITEKGVFSINQTYLRLAGRGEKILGFRSDEYFWNTVGDLTRLEEVRQQVKESGGQNG